MLLRDEVIYARAMCYALTNSSIFVETIISIAMKCVRAKCSVLTGSLIDVGTIVSLGMKRYVPVQVPDGLEEDEGTEQQHEPHAYTVQLIRCGACESHACKSQVEALGT